VTTIRRASGLTINVPDSFRVNDTSGLQQLRRRGTRRAAFRSGAPQDDAGQSAELNALVEALEAQEMEVLDDFEFEAPARPARRGRRAEREAASIEVELGPGENAVVLVEQDGFYSWHLADQTKVSSGPRRRGGRALRQGKTATFRFKISADDRPTRRSARRGMVSDFISGKVRGVVLKFVTGRVLDGAVSFLERNVNKGPVLVTSPDLAGWERVDTLSGVATQSSGAPRILLMVHGTFSSTEGSFGALSAYPWGKRFLEGALANYDAVVGFDHPTLSVTPYQNAIDILEMLRGAGWAAAPSIDAVAFSRGGLVLRSLIEDLLPTQPWPVRVERAVFVACTNNGTRLADPDNWHAMVDLYTNIAMAGARALGLVPQFTAASRIAKETVQGVATLLKYMATESVENRRIPGLAAMDPDGQFVSRINELQPGQPTPETSNYYAITSEFEPGAGGPSEFTARLKQRLANSFVDRMMGGPNDLVVDTASMTSIDEQHGDFIKDVHRFGSNPHVYHTVYFAQPQTARSLTRWLRLIDPQVVAAMAASGTPRAADIARMALDLNEAGAHAAEELPVGVDVDVHVLPADMPAADAAEAIRLEPSRYVVVHRELGLEELDYAFDADDVLARTRRRGRSITLGDALDLHEADRSRRVTTSGEEEDSGGDGTRPAVVVEGGRRIGVLEEEEGGGDAAELADLARETTRRGAVNELRSRSTMPRFEAPEPRSVERMATAAADEAEAPRRRMRGAAGPPRRAARRKGKRKSRHGRARASRSGRASASAPLPPEPASAPCNFHAQMDGEVLVGKTTSVEVIVSRETIERIESAVSATRSADVKLGEKIILQAMGRAHCEVVGEHRVEIDPPAIDDPRLVFFDITPTHAGDGEVWIIARQGQVPLVTLALRPRFVKKATGRARRAEAHALASEARPLSAPLHQLRILDRRSGSDEFLWFEIYSPSLKILKEFTSEPFKTDREEFVNDLYEKLENFWASNKNDYERFMRDLRSFGADLFKQLVPKELRQILWDHRDELKSIQVISEEPFIPWEVVHLVEPGKKLPLDGNVFLGEMGVVRWLYGSFPHEILDLKNGKRLFVVPDYPIDDYALPGAQQERKVLKRLIGATAFAPEESMAVQRLLSQPGGFDILHFACHGVAESNRIWNAALMMKGELREGEYIEDMLTATSVETYGDLQRDDGSGPLVFLNACQVGRAGYSLTGVGGFARAFLTIKAGVFVGTLWSIGDLSAMTFAETFYKELMAGKTVSETAIAAREAAKNAEDVTWLAYVVYGHPHAKVSA
jgi:hypothetical protein